MLQAKNECEKPIESSSCQNNKIFNNFEKSDNTRNITDNTRNIIHET